jgi:hypothetical protein
MPGQDVGGENEVWKIEIKDRGRHRYQGRESGCRYVSWSQAQKQKVMPKCLENSIMYSILDF